MKMLSQTLREIEALSVEIKKAAPEFYQKLSGNPIPLPKEFTEGNNPQGIDLFLEDVRDKLFQHLNQYKSHGFIN